MLLFIHFVFLLLIIHENVQSETQNLSDIRKFVVELRNDSDSMTEYVAKIQAIFCPDQPFCDAFATETRQTVMNTLPETLYVENKTIPVNQLQALIDVCCLPCSCDDTCQENNNCCLTKPSQTNTINSKMASSINTDCIAATSISYRPEVKLAQNYNYYFMVTQCFFDTTWPIQSNCENPNPYDITHTIPVTSLSSGRTYWNQHCAKCNDDAANMVFWKMTVIFMGNFIFYGNTSGSLHRYHADSFEEFKNQLLRDSEIIFIPPFEMQLNRCVAERYQRTCRKSRDDVQQTAHQFLYEICNMFTSPVISGFMRKNIRKNIFCLFCDQETVKRPDKYECNFNVDYKHPPGYMTALLNYRPLDETESATYISPHGNGDCSCREFYDKYQENCRPVYCPPGSLYSGCRCTELMEVVSGMPILLKLKVTPEPGSFYPSTDVLAAKFRKALQKAVKQIMGHVSADIVASFVQENETNSYQLFVAVIRSDFGHDTKETLKLSLDNLDSDKFLKVTTNKNRYLVELGNKIALRRIRNHLGSAFDLQKQIELKLDYSNENYFGYHGIGIYQELSPILFCKQVELDQTEFTELDGQIFINTTSTVIFLSDVYYTAAKQVRVCINQYLPTPLMSSVKINGSVTMALIIFLFCIYLALQQAYN